MGAGAAGLIGLVADTHGLLRPQALQALRGCAHILHAGDVGRPQVIEQLQSVAPVTVVRGNNDDAQAWRDRETVELFGQRLLLLHQIAHLGAVPEGVRVVVYGHSHRPASEWRDGVLFVNPGSAGPRRFKLPVSLARLHVAADGALDVEFIDLLA